MAARATLLALGSAATLTALLMLVAPAGAVVTTFGGDTVGLQPRNVASVLAGGSASASTFSNPFGHPVLHASNTYVIYWDPTDHYHGDWQHLIDHFLQGVGAESGSLGNVFAVDTQYTDLSNKPAYYRSTLPGTYTATNTYP